MSTTKNDSSYINPKPETLTTIVDFTIKELWMLHDFIRHEISDMDKWKFPPANKELNDKIAEALYCCGEMNLNQYYLFLSVGDCYTIDYNIRRDAKTPEGAKGEQILSKVFRAREILNNPWKTTVELNVDKTYKGDKEDASNSTNNSSS